MAYGAGEYTTYYGRALAVVRAGEADVVKASVSDGEKCTAVEIRMEG